MEKEREHFFDMRDQKIEEGDTIAMACHIMGTDRLILCEVQKIMPEKNQFDAICFDEGWKNNSYAPYIKKRRYKYIPSPNINGRMILYRKSKIGLIDAILSK